MKSVVFVLFALSASLALSDACRCIPLSMQPPMEECPDKFLAIVNVTNVRLEEMFVYHDYTVLYDFTPRLKNHDSMSKYTSITSRSNGAVCGRRLGEGPQLVMGALPRGAENPGVSLCNSVDEHLDHVPTEAEAMKLMQKHYDAQCSAMYPGRIPTQ